MAGARFPKQEVNHDSKAPFSSGTELPTPEIESTEPQRTALSKSQRLWNAAYDSLEEDEDTAELVMSYVKTLTTVLGARPDIVSGADASANLKNPTMRQMFMKTLVEEGLAKISTPSKVTKGVGDVAQFIISAKGLIEAAIQNIPQAALPWAGICIGLQVSSTLVLCFLNSRSLVFI